MKKAVQVQDIWQYIPHKPPMVWIDQITDYGATAGECIVNIKKDAHYMDGEGILRASSCVEFIAQAYGFMSICYRVYESQPNAKPLKRAFLASFKDVDFCPEETMRAVKDGDRLVVKISGVRAMGPINLFQGQVFKGDQLLCETNMKVFSES